MYAIRKSDMKEFETRANDVCRIEEGSTNCICAIARLRSSCFE